jgi:hypothetical protein
VTPGRGTGTDLQTLLGRWVRDGLVTPEQAERIRAAEGVGASSTAARTRRQLAIEALGYFGGMLALAAALLLVQLAWDDLSTGARLGAPLVAAALLLLAGSLVPATGHGHEGAARLRSVLWLLAVGAWAAAFAVLGDQVLETSAQDTWLLLGLGALALALPLYYDSHTAPQQLGLLLPAVATVAALGARFDWDEPTLVGAGGWVVAAGWFVLGERGLLRPPVAARYLGAAGMVVLMTVTAGAFGGQVIAAATIATLFVRGVRTDSLELLVLASLGTLFAVPSSVQFFFPDDAGVGVPLALLATGVTLVAIAVNVVRRRAERPTAAGSETAARR